jgi:Fe-S-cluster containining protein
MDQREKSRLCMECGYKCCRMLGMWTNVTYPEAIEFYKARGGRVVNIGKRTMIVFDVDCPNLTDDGCGIYEDRPAICQEFDGRNAPELEGVCLWRRFP